MKNHLKVQYGSKVYERNLAGWRLMKSLASVHDLHI